MIFVTSIAKFWVATCTIYNVQIYHFLRARKIAQEKITSVKFPVNYLIKSGYLDPEHVWCNVRATKQVKFHCHNFTKHLRSI
uniref:Uncharacterized protein n=1 Tax=Lepeophtheirus salmonis TaxID=72036 RepID=A0A0K2T2B2_LEPSM